MGGGGVLYEYEMYILFASFFFVAVDLEESSSDESEEDETIVNIYLITSQIHAIFFL